MNIPKQGTANVVHEDENWRGRVRSENNAAAGFTENWGFLLSNQKTRLADKPEEELAVLHSRLAPARRFMEHTKQQQLLQEKRARSASRRSMGQMILEGDKLSSRPGSKKVSRPGSSHRKPVTDLELSLSASEALSLQPQLMQGVGASICTPGVDPIQKYQYPQTASQHVGWNKTENLEFFGVSQHGRRANAHNAIFDLNER